MMVLKIQIYSLIYSFFYGMFFGMLVRINYRYLYDVKKFIRVVVSFFFIMFNVMFYFMGLKYINNGILHIYFFLCILGGYFLVNGIFSKFNVMKKKK